jgi:hypothetical protein
MKMDENVMKVLWALLVLIVAALIMADIIGLINWLPRIL